VTRRGTDVSHKKWFIVASERQVKDTNLERAQQPLGGKRESCEKRSHLAAENSC